MNRFIALILGLLMTSLTFNVFSQGNPGGKPPYVIDIAGNLKNHRVFKLSEIATDVSYVRLETRPDILIGYGSIKPVGKYIIVGTYKKSIMLFSGEGKFIRSIGSIGKGPGEYKAPYMNQVDPVKEELFVINSGNDRIFRYSFSGKLLQNIPLPHPCNSFYRFPNGNFLLETSSNYKADGFYPFTLIDSSGKLLKEIFSGEVPAGKRMAFSSIPDFNPSENGWVIVSNFGRDVIWQISSSGEIKPYATLLLGKLKMPDELYFDMQKLASKPFSFLPIGFSCQEVNHLINLSFTHELHSVQGYFDSSTNQWFRRDSTESGESGFHNDLDGGPSFGGTREGNCFYTYLMAVDLKQNRKFYEKQEALYPEKKKAMLEMIDALDESDNPVIMIVKLRD